MPKIKSFTNPMSGYLKGVLSLNPHISHNNLTMLPNVLLWIFFCRLEVSHKEVEKLRTTAMESKSRIRELDGLVETCIPALPDIPTNLDDF